jgi:hypothetical protein
MKEILIPAPSPGGLSRRDVLRLLAAGALGPAGLSGWMSGALAAGSVDGVQGVARVDGSATVNGKLAKVGTPVQSGDRVVTGRGAQVVIVVGKDALLLRDQTAVELKGQSEILTTITVASGKVLAVFGKKDLVVKAAQAAIGIRGTGAYFEVEPARVYFCLCYGEAVIDGRNMQSRVVKTEHHESPLYLLDDGTTLRAEPGPFLNHSDEELVMLEALVGREPPFMKSGVYPSKRY